MTGGPCLPTAETGTTRAAPASPTSSPRAAPLAARATGLQPARIDQGPRTINVTCWHLCADGSFLAGWPLRLVSATTDDVLEHHRWAVVPAAEPVALNATGDGRLLVAALADGTL